MKWVLIDGVHINTDLLTKFRREKGYLFLRFFGGNTITILDRDGKLYLKLCHQLGVRPVEEVRENG